MRWPLLFVVALAGCSQKMADMPERKPLDPSSMFSSGAEAQLPVAGTVAADTDLAPQPQGLPAALSLDLMQRGRGRFEIFCAPCHDYTGHGNGRVVQRGFPRPPDFHSPAIIALPDRAIFDTITNGYGVMASYASRVEPGDRWAIVAYIRALQYAEHVPAADLTAELRRQLDGATK